jgi:hypothetical protein
MKILVSIICCSFKEYSLGNCISRIKDCGFDDILLNFEGEPLKDYEVKYLQTWNFNGAGNIKREYDQHQESRLPLICIARNMCLDFAQQGGFDYILFVDSDVIVPNNIMDLFNSPYKVKGGLIKGRGAHKNALYKFYPQEEIGEYTKCHYGSCGSLAIHKDIFWRVRFRWGLPIDGDVVCSEDPIFASDCRILFNEFWYINNNLIHEHIGDFEPHEAAQF